MWDAQAGKAVPVTDEMASRLSRAFAAWERVSGGALAFRHAGESAPSIEGTIVSRRRSRRLAMAARAGR